MKKLVSMLLALMLCLCGLTSAMAETVTETPAEVFPYAFADYKTYFDTLAGSLFSAVPAWTVGEDATMFFATIESWGDAMVQVNEDFQVTTVATGVEISLNGDIATESNKFGQMVALTALTSKAAEDLSAFTEENIGNWANQLLTMVSSLGNKLNEAIETLEPVYVTGELDGNLCTFMLSIDAASETLTFGFFMEP